MYYKTLVRLWRHWYKKIHSVTSVRYSEVAQLTLKTSFKQFLEVEEKNPRVSFWNVLLFHKHTHTRFSGISSLRLDLSGTAPRHLAPVKLSEPSSSSSSSSLSFCLAAGRANIGAWCSSIHKLLILFNHCTKVNNHRHVAFECIKLFINTTLLLEFIHVQSKCFCSAHRRATSLNSYAIFNGR